VLGERGGLALVAEPDLGFSMEEPPEFRRLAGLQFVCHHQAFAILERKRAYGAVDVRLIRLCEIDDRHGLLRRGLIFHNLRHRLGILVGSPSGLNTGTLWPSARTR